MRIRAHLAVGSADGLNIARFLVQQHPGRLGYQQLARFEASMDPGVRSPAMSRRGKHIRTTVLDELSQQISDLAVPYENLFSTDHYR